MDVKLINPFIESLCNVFETMLGVVPKREGVRLPAEQDPNHQFLTSLVGISGSASGVVALRFPVETALQLATKFLGSDYKDVNNEVIDAISELANMVAGSAKARFEMDPTPELGLPSVIEGAAYRVRYPGRAAWLEVPFSSDVGLFSMEVSFSQGK